MSSITTQSETAFRQIYKDLLEHGSYVSPRGSLVLEIEDYQYTLPPYVKFPSFEARKYKPDYVRQEFLWYLRGNPHDLTICEHAKIWQDIVNNDRTINSNYGQYIFSRPLGISPFERVVSELITDKDSRRASIPILGQRHFEMTTKDVPCTYSLNFRIRKDELNMSVHMRSQDAIFGMGNDAPCFAWIHEMVYMALKTKYPDLALGTYTHTADSFHVYERHFEMHKEIVNGSPYLEIEVPKISSADEVHHLIFDIHSRYKDGANAWCYQAIINQAKKLQLVYEDNKDPSYDEFKFANWLLEPQFNQASS